MARNSADWQRLLEICALADTLILDEDGVYDPAGFNDRLFRGLKGTMSEAELYVIKCSSRYLIRQLASESDRVEPVRQDQAAIIFSFASGTASTKVCIGVLPKHHRPWCGRSSLYNEV